MRSRHKDVSKGANADIPEAYYLSVKHFCECFDVGRSRLYEWIADGKVIAKKNGCKILIDVASGLRHFDSLPDFRPPQNPEAHPQP
jgi:hypothetical protein